MVMHEPAFPAPSHLVIVHSKNHIFDYIDSIGGGGNSSNTYIIGTEKVSKLYNSFSSTIW